MIKYLVPSAIVLLACTFRSPAPPAFVDVTIDDNVYLVTTQETTFDASASLLESQAWWGNGTLAAEFATAVGASLGKPTDGGFEGPLFNYAESGLALNSEVSTGSVTTGNLSGGPNILTDTLAFAIAIDEGPALAPVPEATASPALLAAAGLFVVWRGWRSVRPVSA